ncbi:DUF1801 domain-containing protein [Reichenbachiella agarivorans]|uniref:DUF1801 domain-containing protein n=1 Tax=Reichenbachiella agarivorans TaxID=2979464 RepID=A0ABY6CQD8_9BACT|nr:DUF1801 domain-containing protein [Reichenbachiella agarivorans]UXP32737.1 DUF1801 domain-containing protein [Reichenbachiella agarivorans]
MNPKVDFFFDKDSQWQKEYQKLRTIVLDSPAIQQVGQLTEELKWGVPCYCYNEANVVLIHGFKDYCALLFHKGALLNDPHDMLIQQTKNVQAARQIRFTSLDEIIEMEPRLATYITDAIEVEKSGLKVELKKTAEFNMPEEFQKVLDENPDVNVAFENLTPGRQRGYLLHFSQPKQAKTREARIEKAIPHILNGKGIND